MAALKAFEDARGSFDDLYVDHSSQTVPSTPEEADSDPQSATAAAKAVSTIETPSQASAEAIHDRDHAITGPAAGCSNSAMSIEKSTSSRRSATSPPPSTAAHADDLASTIEEPRSSPARNHYARRRSQRATSHKRGLIDPGFARITRAVARDTSRRTLSYTGNESGTIESADFKDSDNLPIPASNDGDGSDSNGTSQTPDLHLDTIKPHHSDSDASPNSSPVKKHAVNVFGSARRSVGRNKLELENAEQDEDLIAMGTHTARIAELNKAVARRKIAETRTSKQRSKRTSRQQRIEQRDDAALKANLNIALADVRNVFGDGQFDLAESMSASTAYQLGKVSAHASTSDSCRRSKRKGVVAEDGTSLSAGSQEEPSPKKRKISQRATDRQLAVEPRRSKRKISRLDNDAKIESQPACDASSAEDGSPVKKRKLLDNRVDSKSARSRSSPAVRPPEAKPDSLLPINDDTSSISELSASDDTDTAEDDSTFKDGEPHKRRTIQTRSKNAASKAKSMQAVHTKQTSKKVAEPVISKSFKGIPSGHGYSSNIPDEHEISTPWQCGFQDCASGMTWLPRNRNAKDGQAVGRKTISHFFGRNKKSTKLIPEDVWHWLCRKHYQRDKYACDRSRTQVHDHQATCLWIIENIEHQLVRLALWRPEATFSIQLMAGGTRRLNTWFAELRKHHGDQQAALRTVPRQEGKALTPEKNFPITLLEHCHNTYLGSNKSYADVRQVLAWVRGEIDAGNTPVMAPVEFLLNDAARGECVNDTTYNYQEWEAHGAGTTFDRATAYKPAASSKPKRAAAALSPFMPIDPSRFEDEASSSDPASATIRNINKMGMTYKPRAGAETCASTEAAS